MSIVEGAFVKVLFPTHEKPREPGLLHICYCLGIAPPVALVAYTATTFWPTDLPVPPGIRIFGRQEAATLNQAPFVLHLNRLAKIALTERWLPDLYRPGQGVVCIAPPQLRDELFQ